uniref:Uncharacterized protein n=1 Tax=Trypanosoma congolense (strain IL3000) TaxID=1068625 RepID=G0UTB7_TRYCI|nr:conserved hypothetical protein [Trypanosoma congolense IL3000]
MTLDLVGKLHRTIYCDGCPPNFYEDFVRLLILKCGPIEGWDVAERLIVVFASVNSISTALTFNGTAFGDLGSSVTLWVATQPPPATVAQQAAITAGSVSKASEIKATLEAKERRLAAIRAELAPDIERDMQQENIDLKLRDLCVRQLTALCTLTSHGLSEMEKSVDESVTHVNSLRQLLESLNKRQARKTRPNQMRLQKVTGAPEVAAATSTPGDPQQVEEYSEIEKRVNVIVAPGEDDGQGRKRCREDV